MDKDVKWEQTLERDPRTWSIEKRLELEHLQNSKSNSRDSSSRGGHQIIREVNSGREA
jgi:hypothetical protein